MTTVTYKGKDEVFELTAEGHAGYAEIGKDIVCASVSILAYQLGQIVTDAYKCKKLKSKPKVILEEGNVRIKCVPFKEYAGEIAYAFYFSFIGFSLLARHYPENVEIRCAEE